jgi:hypothetical protein
MLATICGRSNADANVRFALEPLRNHRRVPIRLAPDMMELVTLAWLSCACAG